MKAERLKEETVQCTAVRLRSLNRENWYPLGDTYIKRNVIPIPAITDPVQEEIGFFTFSESTRVLRWDTPFPISGNPKYFQNASLLSFSSRLHSFIQQVKACDMVPRPDCQLDWRSSYVAVMLRFDWGLRSKTQASSGPLSHHVSGIIMNFLGFSKKTFYFSRQSKQLRNNHTLSPQ
jgi:hypothetical protein